MGLTRIGSIKVDCEGEPRGAIFHAEGRLLVQEPGGEMRAIDGGDCPAEQAVDTAVAMYGYLLAKPACRVWDLRLWDPLEAERAGLPCDQPDYEPGDEDEEEATARTIEVCTNAEFIGLDTDDTPMTEDEARWDFVGRLRRRLAQMGYEVERAKGQRIMYHGWNGANTFARKGRHVGTFDQFTDEEWAAVEAADDEIHAACEAELDAERRPVAADE